MKWYKYQFVGKETIPGIREYDIPNRKGDGWGKIKHKYTKDGWCYTNISPKEIERRHKWYR